MDDRMEQLAAARKAAGDLMRAIIPAGHRCGPIEATEEQWAAIEAAHAAEDAALESLIPDELAAIRLMMDAYSRLKKLGWNDIIYCPKDGSEFDAIEAGSTGIHRAHYTGEWPDGHWWIADAGDLWPSRPILYRVSEEEKARWKDAGKRLRDMIAQETPNA